MKPAPFEFVQASTVETALSLLDEQSRPIAGGQTLGPLLNLRLAQPSRVVDISRIESLRETHDDGTRLVLGACVTHAEIEDRPTADPVCDPTCDLLAVVARGIAYRSVRNRGTVGGSLSYADPAAEWPTVMRALGAEIEARGPRDTRMLAVDDFLDGPMSNTLAPDELLIAVHIPRGGSAARWGYHKRCRKPGDFAEALAVVVKDEVATVTIGGTPLGPVSMVSCAQLVTALSEWNPRAEQDLGDAFAADVDATGMELDDYERQVHLLAIGRATADALTP